MEERLKMKRKIITGLLISTIAAANAANAQLSKTEPDYEEGSLIPDIVVENPAKTPQKPGKKEAEKEKNPYFLQMIFGNNPRTFLIGADGKVHFGEDNSVGSYIIYDKTRGGWANTDFGLNAKLARIIADIGITPSSIKNNYERNTLLKRNSLTPIANGSESRASTQTDNEIQSVGIDNTRIAYTIGYSHKGGWSFGWQQVNASEKTDDSTRIISRFVENFYSRTNEIQEGGIEVGTATDLQTRVDATTDVNVETRQVDNQYRIFFDFWKMALDLNFGSIGSTSNTRTRTSIDETITGNTQVTINGNGIADTTDYPINVHTQSEQSSITDARARQRTAFLKATYGDLVKSGIESYLTIPLKKGPGENLGMGIAYKDFDGNLIGYAEFGMMGKDYNANFVLLGGNEETRKALISHWQIINNLNRSIFETPERKAMRRDELIEQIYRALNGMAFDAKLERTPEDGKSNFGIGAKYGKKGSYGGVGFETASRKTQLKFGCPIKGKNYYLNAGLEHSARDHNYRCKIGFGGRF